jgi:hypothetical protein
MGPEINKVTMNIIPFALFIHLFVAIWVYGSSDIYPQDLEESTETVEGEEVEVFQASSINLENKVIFIVV